jgi:Tfp pilus assembly protein PilO
MSRSRIIIWVLAALVIGYVGLPYLPDGAEMLSGATSARTEAADLRAKSAKADEALADPEGFGAALATARTAVPREVGLPAMIEELETAVRSSGMRWTSGSPAPAATDETSSSWSMSLTISGSARQVPGLLRAINDLDRLVVVDSVQLRGDEEATVVLSVRFFAATGEPSSFESSSEEP